MGRICEILEVQGFVATDLFANNAFVAQYSHCLLIHVVGKPNANLSPKGNLFVLIGKLPGLNSFEHGNN